MVQIVYILNGLSQLAIALLAFYVLFSFYKKDKQIKLIGWILGLNGIFYFIFSFLNISWAFNFLAPNTPDFILLHTIITVISSILLLYVVYKITSNKNLIYLFLIFLISLFSITYGINSFFLITLLLTYFLIIIIFLNLIIVNHKSFSPRNFYGLLYLRVLRGDARGSAYEHLQQESPLKTFLVGDIFTNYLSAGYFGISYAIISLAFLFIYLWSKLSYQLWWFIPHTLNLLILLFIFSGIKKLGVDKPPKRKMHNHPILSIILLYLKYIMFIVSMSGFIFLSTVSIHEVGHVFIAKYYGCEDTKAIIYDWGNYPHAEIKCRNSYNDTIITLGGILSTFIVIIIFLLSGNEFI
ncbi:MAG: hypothetical protein AABY14_02540, partial [Nanoarchaeota archaeon]